MTLNNNIRMIGSKRQNVEDANVTKHQTTKTTTMKPISVFFFLFVVVAAVMIMSTSPRHGHDGSSFLSVDTERRRLRQQQQEILPNHGESSSIDNKPIPSFLHTRNKKHNRISELEVLYHQHFSTFLREIYPIKLAPGTLSSNELNPTEITTLEVPKGGGHDVHAAFILWGKHDPRPGRKDIYASAFLNNDHRRRRVGNFIELNASRRVHYISPFDEVSDSQRREIDRTMVIEGNHIVFFIDYYDTFAHILIDMLPFIAYLRESIMDKSTKLLLPDTGILRNLFEVWDPEFASHKVSWIDCGRDDAIDPTMSKCRRENVRVDVKGGGSLSVVHPTSSLRHMDYIQSFRRWFHQSFSSSNINEDEERFIVYYTRNSQGAGHGRAMDIDQEHKILDWIRRCMERYQRKETLVVFDGSMPARDQIDLFRRANMVIGAHGGGMANLLYLPEVNDLDDQQRPQVLEFMTSPQSPNVQEGSFGRTYYKIYNTAPWIEYHHILYTSQSTHSTTYIDLQEFQTSLDSMFASSLSSSSSSVTSRTS